MQEIEKAQIIKDNLVNVDAQIDKLLNKRIITKEENKKVTEELNHLYRQKKVLEYEIRNWGKGFNERY